MYRKLKAARSFYQVPSRQFSSSGPPPSPYNLPYVDSNDNLGGFMSAVPKDISNISEGVPTYGIWEHFQFVDTVCLDWWMFCTDIS